MSVAERSRAGVQKIAYRTEKKRFFLVVFLTIPSKVPKCSRKRYHESLNNLAPADVYYGRGTNSQRMRR